MPSRLLLLAISLPTVLLSVGAIEPGQEAIFPASAKRDLEVVGLKNLEGSQQVAVPTLYVKMMNWGRFAPIPHPSSAQIPAGKKEKSPRSTLEMGISIDPAAVHAIARELYDDLIARLREAGWQVRTFRDLSTSTALFRLEQEGPDLALGLPLDTISPTKEKRRYVRVAPEGMPVIKDTDGIESMHAVPKEQEMPILVATYIFEPVAFEATAQQTGSSTPPPLGQRASLQLVSASLDFLNPKQARGSIRTHAPIQLWADIGSLIHAPESPADAAFALPKSLAADGIKRKVLYLLRPDRDALERSAVDGGKAFNREAAQLTMKRATR